MKNLISSRAALLVFILAGLFLGLTSCTQPQEEKSTGGHTGGQTTPEVGHPAPAFELQDTRGNTVTNQTVQGKPVMLVFWTSR